MLITVQNFLLITIKRLGTWFSTSMYKSNIHTPAQKWTDYSTKQPGRTHINKKRTPAFAPPPQPKVPRFTETKLKTKSRRSISNTTSHTTNEDVPTLCQSNPDAEQTGKFRRGVGKKVREREHRRNGREGDTLAGSAAAAEARDPAAAAARKGAESCCAMGGGPPRALGFWPRRGERERERELAFRFAAEEAAEGGKGKVAARRATRLVSFL